MNSRIGFFFFIGITLGAFVGYKIAVWPPETAVIGGVLGIVLAVILDRRANAKNDDAKNDNGDDVDPDDASADQ